MCLDPGTCVGLYPTFVLKISPNFDMASCTVEDANSVGSGLCEDIHRVNLPLHAVELRQLPPYQLLEYLEKIWKVPS
jgi:hypothetical protein